MKNYGIKVVNKDYKPTKEELKEFADNWINKQLYWIPTKAEEQEIEKRAVDFFRLYMKINKVYWVDSYIDKKYLSAVRSAVYSAVRSAVSYAVRSAVGYAVRSAVGYAVGYAVDSAVGSAVSYAVSYAVRSAVGSFFWSSSIAYYSYLNKLVKNPYKEFSYAVLGTSGMGFVNNNLYLFRKPIIKMKEKRLHSETDMAIKWPDGNGFYFIDGVKVNEKIAVKPETLTKKDWQDEKNIEARRIIQERMPDFVKKIGGKEVDTVKDYVLYDIDISPDPERTARYLKCKDSSTNRIYYLRVPPKMNNVPDALAWTFNLSKEDYKPLQET